MSIYTWAHKKGTEGSIWDFFQYFGFLVCFFAFWGEGLFVVVMCLEHSTVIWLGCMSICSSGCKHL